MQSGRLLSCRFNLAHGSATSPIGLLKKKGSRDFQSSAVCFSSKCEQNTERLMGSSSCCQVCSYCALHPPPTSFFLSAAFFLAPSCGLLLMSTACRLGSVIYPSCALHGNLTVSSQTAKQACPVLCAGKLVQSPHKVSNFRPPVLLPAICLYLCTARVPFQ